jgi:hypothetical protein
MPLAVVVVLVVTSCLLTALPASGAKGIQHFFFAPGTTTSCELDLAMPHLGTDAYCQTYPHAESATLHPNGKVTVCHGLKCVGNPPEQVPTLAYGASLSAGPIRCTSLRTGVKCVIAKSGHGFLLSPTKLTLLK